MTPSRRKAPSAGFVVVCLIHALVVAFFLWGFSTPDLDRVWTLHHQLKIGEMGRLARKDREIVLNAARRHPKLASALLSDEDTKRGIGLISAHEEGWIATPDATILRTAAPTEIRTLVFDIRTPKDLIPFAISVRGTDWQEKISADKQGIERLRIPAAKAGAELITVRIKGKGFRADPSVISIRVSFETGDKR